MTETINLSNILAESVDCCFSRGRVLLVSVTSACNQRCIHCMRDAGPRRPGSIDLNTFVPALAENIAEVHPERVVISGGEPTLLHNLIDIIRAIRRLGVCVGLCTNAVRIDDDYARRLASSGLEKATIGIDGTCVDHDRFRRSPYGYDRALAGIGALVRHGVSVTVNATLHDAILQKGNEFGLAMAGRGLTSITITSPIATGRLLRERGNFESVTDETLRTFALAVAGAADCPVSLRTPRCDRSSCPSGDTVFSMDVDGNLMGCPDTEAKNIMDVPRARFVGRPLTCV